MGLVRLDGGLIGSFQVRVGRTFRTAACCGLMRNNFVKLSKKLVLIAMSISVP